MLDAFYAAMTDFLFLAYMARFGVFVGLGMLVCLAFVWAWDRLSQDD